MVSRNPQSNITSPAIRIRNCLGLLRTPPERDVMKKQKRRKIENVIITLVKEKKDRIEEGKT
jgi:hypothetical protein